MSAHEVPSVRSQADERVPRVPGVFPDAAAHEMNAPHVRRATVRVVVDGAGTQIVPIWAHLGYDEINWTYTRTGRRLLKTIGEFSPVPFHVRSHNVFVSGSGFGLPHQGSGNVYHEDENGKPFYDFAIVDQAYDSIVDAGHHVLVELGFTPRDLVPDRAFDELRVVESPTVYSAYEAGHWAYPPKDYEKWGALVSALAEHCLERYGEREVCTWLWELWNEPDISYWRGDQDEFDELYAVTAVAVRAVLPSARVGGPAVTGGPGGSAFLRRFLTFVDERDLPLDFVSFHTKGSRFVPWRTYGPIGADAARKQSPQTSKMLSEIRTNLRIMACFPHFRDLPAVVDECDAGVPAHWGVYDNSNFRFQNTEYFPVFQVNLMKKLLDLNGLEASKVRAATTWSFYFEGERYFEGTRSFLTAGGVEKPMMNAYRLLARLGSTRVPATSDRAWRIEDLDSTSPTACPEEVDVLATRDEGGEIALLVYRRADDQYQTDTEPADVAVEIVGLGTEPRCIRHFRIDHDHSNAHTAWVAQGSPQDPTPEQLAAVRERMGLEEIDAPEITIDDGIGRLQLQLPLGSVSLIVLEYPGGAGGKG